MHSVTLNYFLEVDILRLYISEMVRASARMTGKHLPSNGVIAKIALRDLDLLSRSKHFKMYIFQTVRAGTKTNVWETFADFDICHRMV